MRLSERLELIAKKVPICETVCDIGTDHAFIPIFLMINKICKKVIATDLREGPIQIAKKNIDKYGLCKSIETRVGDGFTCLNKDEADVVVIAGMGGTLICEILNSGYKKAKETKILVLQPMTAANELRKFLHYSGYDIVDEELASEGDKIYTVICAEWTGIRKCEDEIYHYIGRKLFEKKDPLLNNYINKKINQTEKILKGLNMSLNTDCDSFNKYKLLIDELKAIYNK